MQVKWYKKDEEVFTLFQTHNEKMSNSSKDLEEMRAFCEEIRRKNDVLAKKRPGLSTQERVKLHTLHEMCDLHLQFLGNFPEIRAEIEELERKNALAVQKF